MDEKFMSLSRMFTSADDVQHAVHELTEAGFPDGTIHVLDSSIPSLNAAMLEEMGVSKDHSKAYVAQIKHGATMLLVQAPLGSAGIATDILESISPNNSGEPQVRYEGWQWDDSTPVSSALRWPTLTKQSTPLSSFFGWPILSKALPKEKWFGMPLLLRDYNPMALMMGMNLISTKQFTISSWLGLPLLKK